VGSSLLFATVCCFFFFFVFFFFLAFSFSCERKSPFSLLPLVVTVSPLREESASGNSCPTGKRGRGTNQHPGKGIPQMIPKKEADGVNEKSQYLFHLGSRKQKKTKGVLYASINRTKKEGVDSC